MKKLLSVVAMALMIIGLTGCMDNPDSAKQSVRDKPSKVENPYN